MPYADLSTRRAGRCGPCFLPLCPGVTFSNSYTLETSFGWTGVCVEPLAGPFAQLTRARSCVAINACAYNETTTVTFQNISGISEMLSGIMSK